MSFKWKDRDGAVNLAAYQFRKSREYVLDLIRNMTTEEIERDREIFENPEYTPRFNDKNTLIDCASEALGTGTRFKNYFCLDPEAMKGRQWTQFVNDIKAEIERRDHMDKFLAEHKAQKEAEVTA